ncbi:MAG: SUF system NifU family Fe-S cluster assembly protein [Spirochaetia bacterium]
MNFADDLYKEIILDHYRSKKNRRRLDTADYSQEGINPSCGDDIELFIKTDDGIITEVTYDGIGCSICTASANMLCEALVGNSTDFAEKVLSRFKGMLTRAEEPDFPDSAADLEAMQGVRDFPVRIKCALLAWNTLGQILEDIQSDGKGG